MKRNNNNIKIKSALGDGSYDGNENFDYLQKNKIKPAIKVRKNSIMSLKNNKMRNKEVKLQTKDLLKWKKKRKYGHIPINISKETRFIAMKITILLYNI